MGRLLPAIAVAMVLGPAVVMAQHDHAGPAGTATLLSGLGTHHHPIATRSADAQRFFDQGLTLVFAFNHDEAVRSFQRAAALDPRSPMPPWGIALALGPNINLDVDPARERAAHDAVQHARKLARSAPAPERDYVEALVRRYTADPDADLKQLAVDYSRAMRELSGRYPDDLDAATLYAESLMDLNPWRLWTANGKPAEGTEEIVTVLESVLARDPEHVGANHYYIHAIEASPHPERALPSARRLETLVPAAGHLVHMPAHVYMRTGDYDAAARSNAAAVAVDRAYLASTGAQGVYPAMYTSHNLSFLSRAHAMSGRYPEARRAAEELVTHVRPFVPEMPMGEYALSTPLFVDLRFARWQVVIDTPAAASDTPLTQAVWRFGRGVAWAQLGKPRQAEEERRAFVAARAQVPADAVFGDTGLNSAKSVLDLAASVLDARIAACRHDREDAIVAWREAVVAEDALTYDEPSTWYYPVRESLGAALLRDGRPAEAEEVFRADLVRNPRNPRSLLGLIEALEAQDRGADATWVRRAFQRSWDSESPPPRLRDL